MKLILSRQVLLNVLQAVIGVVERKQTMPILANILFVANNNKLLVTATDLEVELCGSVEVDVDTPGEITIPARKLLDICRALPENSQMVIKQNGPKIEINSGQSRFSLMTLPAAEFPTIGDINSTQTISIEKNTLSHLLNKTHFSMAQQDVRYYLNGVLIEIKENMLKAVATDGHRLALSETTLEENEPSSQQVIVPRKGVLELQRLISGKGGLSLELGNNHIRIELEDITFTSKLIDGRFPDYDRVIPSTADNIISANKNDLKSALQRTAILSNEKYRGIRLIIKDSSLLLQAQNPEQEEAEEKIAITYQGEPIEIGFNVNYLLDALSAIDSDTVNISLIDSNSSCLISEPDNIENKYVVMPMRL